MVDLLVQVSVVLPQPRHLIASLVLNVLQLPVLVLDDSYQLVVLPYDALLALVHDFKFLLVSLGH